MRIFRFSVLATFAFSLTACDPNRSKVPGVDAVLPGGFNCALSATDFDPPGVVFRVSQGKRFYVKNFEESLTTTRRAIVTGEFTRAMSANAGLLGKFLSLGETNPIGLQLGTDVERRVTFRLADAVNEISTDVDRQEIIEWFRGYEDRDRRSSYYLVRDAISASKIQIQLSSELVSSLGGSAELKTYAANGSGSLKYSADSDYQLVKSLGDPMRVCIKVEKLDRKRTGASTHEYTLVPVSEYEDLGADRG